MSYSFKTRAPMMAEARLEAICAATTVAAVEAAAATATPATTVVKGYVPPSQRTGVAAQKPVGEEFPTLGLAPAAKQSKGPVMKFSDMFKPVAAPVSTVPSSETVVRSGLRVVDCPPLEGNDDDDNQGYIPRHGAFLQRVSARLAAAASRRRRIFDSGSEGDLEEANEVAEEIPDEDSWNDDDSGNSQEGGEEGMETYDATAFDRHR